MTGGYNEERMPGGYNEERMPEELTQEGMPEGEAEGLYKRYTSWRSIRYIHCNK